MNINVDYLEQLFSEYFDVVGWLSRLEEIRDFPDDGYSLKSHDKEVERAKIDRMKAKNRIYSYLEYHGG